MLVVGIVFLSMGTMVTGVATYLEWKLRDPFWKLLMKVGPWLLGVGGMLFGLAMVGA